MLSQAGKVLTIGWLTWDMIASIDHFASLDDEVAINGLDEYDGGSAANVALGVARLGARSSFLSCVGRDAFDSGMISRLQAEGVDTSRVFTSPTGTGTARMFGFVTPDGSRQLYTYSGAATEFTVDDVTPERLAGVDLVHICTMSPSIINRVVDVARELGKVAVATDPGCLVIGRYPTDEVTTALRRVDYLYLNALEARILVGDTTPEVVVPRLGVTLPERVIVKLGEEGFIYYELGKEPVAFPGFSVNCID
ncbi:MAG: carbohydrate kinase family protein, partial [Firmicutes bacterium]|nr:carbohydrate kinase family protein [Bacillota bacterium]